MLNVKEELSEKTKANVDAVIKEATGRDDFQSLYAYKELNLYFITLITHYALGFNQEEVVALPMGSQGGASGELMRFKKSHDISKNLWGKICLSNGEQKVKLTVPGMVPSGRGLKYLPVEQTQLSYDFYQWVKDLEK